MKVRIPIHPKDRNGLFWLMLAGNAAQAGLPETGAEMSRSHRASPEASFVTGTDLLVDGGYAAR